MLSDLEPTPPFERKEYVVTDVGCQVCLCLTCPFHFMPVIPGFMGTKTLLLEPEEAVATIECCNVCDLTTRRPYGELGSVDETNFLCCTGFQSDLTKGMPICPGWGCERELSADIVRELKARMKVRGDTGQIKRSEETLKEVQLLREEVGSLKADMKAIMKHLDVPPQSPVLETMDRKVP